MLRNLAMLAQGASLVVGGYLCLTRSWVLGVGLVVAVQALHWISERAIDRAMLIHSRTLTDEERASLMGAPHLGIAPRTPPEWLRFTKIGSAAFSAIAITLMALALRA